MSQFSGVELNHQLIAGTWRAGSSERSATDNNPFDDSVITDIQQASAADVDKAYEAARADS
ncbi:aldehyde dehydrogenase, partial [Corynebacterium casei]